MEKIYLILENGKIFEGKSFGAKGETIGELVFTTGMTGYLETLTDPRYYGQIVVQTFPMIGNYGIIPQDAESFAPALRAYVVRDFCSHPSNFRCQKDLNTYLKENNVIGIYDVDTREITRTVREYGVMNAAISFKKETPFELKNYKVKNAVESVTSKGGFYPARNAVYNVALIDYGAKANIIRELNNNSCNVTVFSSEVKAEEILDGKFDALMLSNGPGDPKENLFQIEQLKKLFGKIPIFGICLGHQLLALATGADTGKLKYGHRGTNQPVKDLNTGKVFITSQNHGYAVLKDSLKGSAIQSFENANDKTCEGIDYIDKFAFTVQFHPEACAGPLDSNYLFKRFIKMIEDFKNA